MRAQGPVLAGVAVGVQVLCAPPQNPIVVGVRVGAGAIGVLSARVVCAPTAKTAAHRLVRWQATAPEGFETPG